MSSESSISSKTAESAPVFDITKSTLISLNMSNITKLSATNFIKWRLQVQSHLETHELQCFIDETDNAPSQKLTTESGTEEPNPSFAAWNRQDKMLYSALLGSLSLAVQPIIARDTTTREVLKILAQTYGKPTRGHIKQLKQQIKITKGTKSINEYMRSIIDKADKLALLGAAYDHEDLLDIITDGLGDDYRAVVDMVNGRDTPISIDELHEKLIVREHTLSITTPVTTNIPTPVTANAAQARPQQNQSYSAPRGGYQGSSRGGFRPQRPYLGKCQICGVQGHGARRCPQYQQPQQYQPMTQPGFYQPSYRGSPQWAAPHLPLPTP